MDEYGSLVRIAQSKEFQDAIKMLQTAWSDTAFGYTADFLMQHYSLECIEGPDHRSLTLYSHKTRKYSPAFIYVHREFRQSRYDWTLVLRKPGYTISVMEAGKHAVARPGENAVHWTEAEG